MSTPTGWCTIESDPGVFTELVEQLGVSGLQVEELFTLEKTDFERLKPIYGLVFLFKWKDEEIQQPVMSDYDPHQLFFANQVINNACATQALLSILLNLKDKEGVEIGDELTNFLEFTQDFPPDMKGLAISNSDKIRTVHNSFARPEPFIPEERKAESGDDVFHFIAYLPKNGHLYELDGLREGPIDLGECTDENWVDSVIPVIQARVARYSASEIHFNLMALAHNRVSQIEKHIAACEEQLRMESEKDAFNAELVQLRAELQEEMTKRELWRKENIRRRHNYIPFLVGFLRVLAEKDLLGKLVEQAQETKKRKK